METDQRTKRKRPLTLTLTGMNYESVEQQHEFNREEKRLDFGTPQRRLSQHTPIPKIRDMDH